jgi:hypothetical protein
MKGSILSPSPGGVCSLLLLCGSKRGEQKASSITIENICRYSSLKKCNYDSENDFVLILCWRQIILSMEGYCDASESFLFVIRHIFLFNHTKFRSPWKHNFVALPLEADSLFY